MEVITLILLHPCVVQYKTFICHSFVVHVRTGDRLDDPYDRYRVREDIDEYEKHTTRPLQPPHVSSVE